MITKKWWYKGFTLEVMKSQIAAVNPFWAHITEFPKNCPDEIKRMLGDYTFDDESEVLAINGLKMIIDRSFNIYNEKTQNGKYAYICE